MSRASRPILPFGTRRIVLEGHGEYHAHDGEVNIPDGTIVIMHTGPGCAIEDDVAIALAHNEKIPVRLPDEGVDPGTGDVLTNLRGLPHETGPSGSMRTFRAGDRGLLNYTLLPPTDPPAFIPQPASITVAFPTTLQELVDRYRGESIVWAACTVIR